MKSMEFYPVLSVLSLLAFCVANTVSGKTQANSVSISSQK